MKCGILEVFLLLPEFLCQEGEVEGVGGEEAEDHDVAGDEVVVGGEGVGHGSPFSIAQGKMFDFGGMPLLVPTDKFTLRYE